MIRIGIVGCGRIVEEGHALAFEQLRDRFEIVAVADPSEERRDLIGGRFGVPPDNRYSTWNDLLRDDSVDLVDMAVPHFLHRDSCVAAAASGKAILMEKPMATSLKEADEIMAAVTKSGAPACIIHNYLYSANSSAALEVIGEGGIGRPFLVRIESLSDSHWPGAKAYDPDWRTRTSTGGGGALIDNAYHSLYSAAAYMGSPVTEVYARLGTFVRDIEVEDTVVTTLTHSNGGTSQILIGWSVGAAKRVQEIHGDEGSILFDHDGRKLSVLRGDDWSYPDVPEEESSSFAPLFEEYADALESGAPPPVPFEEGYRNLKVVMAAYESNRTGRPIAIE
ncbi:MAG: Gfo/Idh/MocA family oxidoreductase [Chloroflexi bacterium]|nr:Gfo/Idh/MocA family oxidoreductase [Chloroflexota bacterium]